MLIGVSEQFGITLILEGVGYRANVQGKTLVLNLGFSHLVNIIIPDEITVEVVQNTTINIKACDKEQLGLFAAKVYHGVHLNLIKEKEYFTKVNKYYVKLVNRVKNKNY